VAGFGVGYDERSGSATRTLVEATFTFSMGKEINNSDHEAVSKYCYCLPEKEKKTLPRAMPRCVS
jgi:hypothetical protein